MNSIGHSDPFHSDFFNLQKKHNRKSILIFLLLVSFYVVCMFLILLVTVGFVLFVTLGPDRITSTLLPLAGVALCVAIATAALNMFDAVHNGPTRIIQRLNASAPDPHDTCHQRFINVLSEISISAGVPTVRPFVIPDASVNSLTLLQTDRIPAVAVTEGLLAVATRDELQAVVAHEIAHVLSGDLMFITLVVSLMTPFEYLARVFQQDDTRTGPQAKSSGFAAVLYSSGCFSYFFIRILSTMVSRERELQTDAHAIELTRNPEALATIIFKAFHSAVHLGDFSLAYSPVFIVSPYMGHEDDSFLNRILDTHPPIGKRLHLIGRIAGIAPHQIAKRIEAQEPLRFTRTVQEAKTGVREELVMMDRSTSGRMCPECQTELALIDYEGTQILSCRTCHGALVHPTSLMRILIRRNVRFSADLQAMADEHRKRIRLNPLKRKARGDHERVLKCPNCGIGMIACPYSYHHFVPIDRCLRCRWTWFDANELEILQILIENSDEKN